jgi:prephenate dehydrogenase
MRIQTLAIVGVGLIGGSIGLAAKRRGIAERILGVGRRSTSLATAQELGAIDEGVLELLPAVRRAQVVVFCTPVDGIAEQILTAAPSCAPGTLLTDAGSTKAKIVRSVDGRLPQGVHFVGSHPLAGSEKQGAQHADVDLFQNRITVVTQTAQTDSAALERTASLWQALGSRVKILAPEAHDQALALTSHLPHLLAAALAGILPPEFNELTASGFRDTTRVAAGDPLLWTAIFEHNRTAVLEALSLLNGRMDQFRAALEASDWNALKDLLNQAKGIRDALGS